MLYLHNPNIVTENHRKSENDTPSCAKLSQHLRIKTFYGTSPNAVKTQIWIAFSIYLLVAILKKRLHLPGNLHTILQILEVNIFEKRPIIQIVKDAYKQEPEPSLCNQLNLFNS
jgi:hypothetical protein